VLEPSQVDFYGTVAQVIPVLLLAAAVELRFFSAPDDVPWWERVGFYLFGLFASAVLLVGEYAALRVAARAEVGKWEPYAVDLGLYLGLLYVFGGLVLRLRPPGAPKLIKGIAVVVFVLAILGLLVSFFAGLAPRAAPGT